MTVFLNKSSGVEGAKLGLYVYPRYDMVTPIMGCAD